MRRISPSGPTATERVYEDLRADVLAGRLVPGQRLKVQDIAGTRGVSMNAVREALSRLAGEGLVEARPRQGFAVKTLSMEHLTDLTEVRVQWEQLLLRWAIERGDTEWESGLVAAHHTLARSPRSMPDDPQRVPDTWMQAHADFHAALLAGSGSTTGCAVAATLMSTADLYRIWSLSMGPADRDVAHEHLQIMEAALDRDADRACDLLADHYLRTADNLRTALAAGVEFKLVVG